MEITGRHVSGNGRQRLTHRETDTHRLLQGHVFICQQLGWNIHQGHTFGRSPRTHNQLPARVLHQEPAHLPLVDTEMVALGCPTPVDIQQAELVEWFKEPWVEEERAIKFNTIKRD